jgi:hypothetical protein
VRSALSGVREALTITERRGLEHPLTKYRAKQSPPMSQAALARLLGVRRTKRKSLAMYCHDQRQYDDILRC